MTLGGGRLQGGHKVGVVYTATPLDTRAQNFFLQSSVFVQVYISPSVYTKANYVCLQRLRCARRACGAQEALPSPQHSNNYAAIVPSMQSKHLCCLGTKSKSMKKCALCKAIWFGLAPHTATLLRLWSTWWVALNVVFKHLPKNKKTTTFF